MPQTWAKLTSNGPRAKWWMSICGQSMYRFEYVANLSLSMGQNTKNKWIKITVFEAGTYSEKTWQENCFTKSPIAYFHFCQECSLMSMSH